jgi:hypothetical protein
MRVIVAEKDARAVRARDSRAVPRARAVGAIAVDLVEVGDALADVEDGRERRVPRQVAQDRIVRIPRLRFARARPGEARFDLADLRLNVL